MFVKLALDIFLEDISIFLTVSKEYFSTIFSSIVSMNSTCRTYITGIALKIAVLKVICNPKYENRPAGLHIAISTVYVH